MRPSLALCLPITQLPDSECVTKHHSSNDKQIENIFTDYFSCIVTKVNLNEYYLELNSKRKLIMKQ